MEYPSLGPPVVAQPAAKAATGISTKTIVIIVVCVLVVIAGIIIVGVGLGVGLGLGLKKDSSSSSSSFQVETANCVYSTSTCGCAATKPTFASSKIVNGHVATAHSWPWVVAIYYNNQLLCGGFLADSYNIVITAAHCLSFSGFNSANVKIYAGIDSRSSLSDGQVSTISSYKVHDSYSSSAANRLNDIAVIKLTSTFTKNNNVGLCCLPSGSTSLPTQGQSAILVGWGQTVYGQSSSVSDVLRQAEVQVQANTVTNCNVASTSYAQFCAGYGTRDTCQGDSGGPLMTVVDNLWSCTGIVSYGLGCGTNAYYTRVSYYRSFIDSTISTLT